MRVPFPAPENQEIPAFRSALQSEKNASVSNVSPAAAGAGEASAPAPKKPRSCVTCRSRKVRCDKLSPCSNCRRANIACVFPSQDKPPRWARRLERIANSAKAAQENGIGNGVVVDPGVSQVMDRLRSLEGLVKELSGQLEQAHAAAAAAGTSSSGNSPGSSSNQDADSSVSNVRKQFGRLVLGDGDASANTSCYVSSGFWSRVNDELDNLKTTAELLPGGDYDDSSGDEDSPGRTPPSTQEHDRTPSERHAFLFNHNLNSPAPALRELHPLPSQVPFLLNVFHENINCMCQIVHVPSVNKMIRDVRGDFSALAPANEALLFAIYYGSIISMEEDDIMTNFGASKADLGLQYRLGLEYALAKADFINVPDIVLVQAFAIFLMLARRHDSPRFVWMMTGLVIRMAQSLGLQRDGSHFPELSPFQVEMRRRVWWVVLMLDLRSSEDLGADLTIQQTSFDTQLPLSINDSDMDPYRTEIPVEREGITDMTLALVSIDMIDIMRQMMAFHLKDGSLDEQNRLLNEMWERLEGRYLRYSSASDNIAYWVNLTITRLVVAKMTLIIYLPALFSSPNEHFSDEIRAKLFVAAIEVAESNHALNNEPACRNWRWIFQTYTHWHAIVYLMMAAAQRPWSPAMERAWIALRSPWLIPAQESASNAHNKIWVPLRKLIAKARRHRDSELQRLRADPQAACRLLDEDRRTLQPKTSASFPDPESAAESFRDSWRQLVAPMPESASTVQPAALSSRLGDDTASTLDFASTPVGVPLYSPGLLAAQPSYLTQSNLPPQDIHLPSSKLNVARTRTPNQGNTHRHQHVYSPSFPPETAPAAAPPAADWSSSAMRQPTSSELDPGFGPWLLWADSDPSVDVFANIEMDQGAVDFTNMDLDAEQVDWNNWFESARGMEMQGGDAAGVPGGWI